MDLPATLHKETVDFLTSLPNITDSNEQQAFIMSASLDDRLNKQIKFPGSTKKFFELLVPPLVKYGQLRDGRNALVAVLEAAKGYVGQDKKAYCEGLIQQWHQYLLQKPANLPKYFENLPQIDDECLGREKEMNILNDTWNNQPTNILCFYTWGGAGKTTLVKRWLSKRRGKGNFHGATRVYGWSFYNQGISEKRQTSSEQFLAHALEWFGEPAPHSGGPKTKGERLAKLIQQHRVLLILDGLEPLQDAVGGRHGWQLKDVGIKALLKTLQFPNPGLCVITTRYKIANLDSCGELVKQIQLDDLPEKAGIELLTRLGVKGEHKELADAVKKFKHHALTLSLLGTYLKEFHDGDIHQLKWISHLISIDGEEGELARGVMKTYEERLAHYTFTNQSFKALHNEDIPSDLLDKLERLKNQKSQDKKGFLNMVHKIIGKEGAKSYETVILKHAARVNNSPELIILYLLGIFDRPAEKRALQRLYATPIIKGLMEPLQDLSDWEMDKEMDKKIKRLRKLRLLLGHDKHNPDMLDSHPLIREYFGERLQEDHPDAWKEAHRRLFDYYRERYKFTDQSFEALQTRFELTKKSFKALHDEHIPGNLLGKLTHLIHQKFPDENSFLDAVNTHIEKKEMMKYKALILQHAALPDGPVPDNLIEKLQPLKNELILGKEEFLNEVHSRIGKEEMEKYQTVILKHALELPDKLPEMNPLYRAVAHGCQAGKYQAALDEVFIPRIRRGSIHYSLWHLGALGEDLAAFSGFFVTRWTELVKDLNAEGQTSILNTGLFKDLNAEGQTYILNEVGSIFRASGQLEAAKKIIRKSAELAAEKCLYAQAALSYKNLSQTLMSYGKLQDAIETAEKSLDFAKEDWDWFLQYAGYSNYGRALHLAGEWEKAAGAFHNMVQKAKDVGIHPRGLQAFCYCDFLLDIGETKHAHTIAQTAVNESTSVRDKGLGRLSLGKVYFALNKFKKAKKTLNKAVKHMHQSSRQDELPGALLALARLYRKQGNLEKADEHLKEAYEIASNGGMEIHLADYQLEKAKHHLFTAKNKIDLMAYRRRDKEIESLLQPWTK